MVDSRHKKIIQSLDTQFIRTKNIQVLNKVIVPRKRYLNNMLLTLYNGHVSIHTAQQKLTLKSGDMCLIPAGTLSTITYGTHLLTAFEDPSAKSYGQQLSFIETDTIEGVPNTFNHLYFNTKVHHTINFFPFIELPLFVIKKNHPIRQLVQLIGEENNKSEIGKSLVLNYYTSVLVTLFIRYIIDRALFPERFTAKMDVLSHKKLESICTYTAQHLTKDLSNQSIAAATKLSCNYVGQYFKRVTNTTLQEHVKTIRLEKGLELLKTKNLKIHEISEQVGFRFSAYFCKEFRLKFGQSAKQLQKQWNNPMNL